MSAMTSQSRANVRLSLLAGLAASLMFLGCAQQTGATDKEKDDKSDAGNDIIDQEIGPVDADTSSADAVCGLCCPGEAKGCADNNHVLKCSDDGSGWISFKCVDDEDNVTQCILPGKCAACAKNQKRCNPKDASIVQQCDDQGQWNVLKTCDAKTGQLCFANECVEACKAYEKANAYIGCDFWATDLDNAFVPGGKRGYYDAAGSQYAVVVSNASDQLASDIKISTHTGPVKYDSEGDFLDVSPLPPGKLRIFNLPARNINGTSISKQAYRISSSAPISAYQFNPLENVNVFSNDASLLLPAKLYGRYYMVMSREQSFGVLRGFVTIVATYKGLTTVAITFSKTTTKTLANEDQKIKVYKAGESAEFTLEQWDTLNIETDDIGSDLTGTIIVANKPIGVWAGSEAANAPNTNHCDTSQCSSQELKKGYKCGVCQADNKVSCFKNEHCRAYITCCADHLEMQLFPVKTWGSHYVAVKLWPRGKESDYWRIMAAEDGTKVITKPGVKDPKGKPIYVPVLDKGDWFEIETTDNFEIIAQDIDGKPAPIMVGHFMASQNAPDPNTLGPQTGDAGTGDPAFLLAIPVEQWRKNYVFLTPTKYAFNYSSIAAPIDADVTLDGKLLPPDFWKKVSKKFKWTRIFVGEGVHTVTATGAVAVEVYGWDQYVSYGYPAGLDLKDLELIKEPGDP
jgi:hypothetical protein